MLFEKLGTEASGTTEVKHSMAVALGPVYWLVLLDYTKIFGNFKLKCSRGDIQMLNATLTNHGTL